MEASEEMDLVQHLHAELSLEGSLIVETNQGMIEGLEEDEKCSLIGKFHGLKRSTERWQVKPC